MFHAIPYNMQEIWNKNYGSCIVIAFDSKMRWRPMQWQLWVWSRWVWQQW